jgi:subtilisin family serine protease
MSMKLSRFIIASALSIGAATTHAATINLVEYAFNVDGIVTSDAYPAGMNSAAFDPATGLGTLTYVFTDSGAHYFAGFFDHEIDEADNTFFNEIGASTGVAAAGQTWEIDEPGFAFGNVYDNFLAGSLDNTNAIPAGSDPSVPADGVQGDDVSMALAWNFTLAPGSTGTVQLFLSQTAPTSGFYLSHTDPESVGNPTIYYWSTLAITGTEVPEPGTMLLFGAGLAGLAGFQRRRPAAHAA